MFSVLNPKMNNYLAGGVVAATKEPGLLSGQRLRRIWHSQPWKAIRYLVLKCLWVSGTPPPHPPPLTPPLTPPPHPHMFLCSARSGCPLSFGAPLCFPGGGAGENRGDFILRPGGGGARRGARRQGPWAWLFLPLFEGSPYIKVIQGAPC